MQKLDQTINLILPLLSKDSTDVQELRTVVTRLFREGIDLDTLIDFINERHHQREAEDLPELPTVGDLKDFLRSLLEPTEDNRRIWAARFKAGHAQYWCPDCGYAGNGEEFKSPDSGNVICGACGCLEHIRYFTRAWTTEEQAAYEAEQARIRPLIVAQDQRKLEKQQYTAALEPKVNEVLAALDGVGDYVNEAEERNEVGPYVRGVVHATTLSVDQIVAAWKRYVETYRILPPSRISEHEFAARTILRRFSMKDVLDNIDNYIPSELEPLGAGEERHFFTREDFIHEMTVNTARWQSLMDTRDLSTSLGLDWKFAITVHAKGYAEAHPCDCDDCKVGRVA